MDPELTKRISIGERNVLEVSKEVDFGVYLVDQAGEEILLPARYVAEGTSIGDYVDVFVYTDSDDRPVAVTDQPKIMVGEVAVLEVVGVSRIGAFLDWGLPKDLLVPARQQAETMKMGEKYVVYAYLDKQTNRVAASPKLSLYLKEESTAFYAGQAVELLISGKTRLGYKAVVNGTHLGVLFHSDVRSPIAIGEKRAGFIKNVRSDDGRIDLSLEPVTQVTRRQLHEQIMHELRMEGGVSTITDKSTPEVIFEKFGVSKGAYKKALGALYKDKKILLEKQQIKLVKT